ncbi:hypothetical protein BDV93DRAFT_322720 [Ceratobasidium sp. AG-I]|nr:hypothetical protein BDV93DRAFT_322720 [Ceratobasidium sp. AG-I]
MSSARRVADIPELIGSIAAILSSRHPLLLASKHFFRSVAPLIWQSVPRVDLLLRLIPEIGVWRTDKCDVLKPVAHSIFDDVKLPSTPNLDRFNVYAPWVQRLEVFGGDYKYILQKSEALFHLAFTHPILPNLRALTLTITAEPSTDEHLFFTELFLSPTLVEIRHVRQGDNPPYLEIRSAPGLVQKILAVCPGVQILEFYPGHLLGRQSALGRNTIFSLPDISFHMDLARFSNLRSFTGTLNIFEPATLQALGSLPLLESLDAYDCAEDLASLDEGLTIPETWFPSLRHLHLRNFDAEDVSIV